MELPEFDFADILETDYEKGEPSSWLLQDDVPSTPPPRKRLTNEMLDELPAKIIHIDEEPLNDMSLKTEQEQIAFTDQFLNIPPKESDQQIRNDASQANSKVPVQNPSIIQHSLPDENVDLAEDLVQPIYSEPSVGSNQENRMVICEEFVADSSHKTGKHAFYSNAQNASSGFNSACNLFSQDTQPTIQTPTISPPPIDMAVQDMKQIFNIPPMTNGAPQQHGTSVIYISGPVLATMVIGNADLQGANGANASQGFFPHAPLGNGVLQKQSLGSIFLSEISAHQNVENVPSPSQVNDEVYRIFLTDGKKESDGRLTYHVEETLGSNSKIKLNELLDKIGEKELSLLQLKQKARASRRRRSNSTRAYTPRVQYIISCVDDALEIYLGPTASSDALNPHKRPPGGFNGPIYFAFKRHGFQALCLDQIYKTLLDLFPYYHQAHRTWQSSVRERLIDKKGEKFFNRGKEDNDRPSIFWILPEKIQKLRIEVQNCYKLNYVRSTEVFYLSEAETLKDELCLKTYQWEGIMTFLHKYKILMCSKRGACNHPPSIAA